MQTRTYLRIFLAVAVVLWLLVEPWAYLAEEWDVKTLARYATTDADVVYLGDSIVYSTSPCDRDGRTLAELTAEEAGLRVFPFAHAAFSPFVYRKLAPLLTRFNASARVVVMPITLASFADGLMSPAFQFPRRQMLYDFLALRIHPLAYLRLRYTNAEHDRQRAWSRASVYDDRIALGTISSVNARLRKLRAVPCDGDYGRQGDLVGLRLALYYGNPIGPQHPLFDDIRTTVDTLRSDGRQVLLYLSPIDLQAIDTLAGEPLSSRVRENLETVRRVAREHGWPLLDLSAALSDRDFADRQCACGHLQVSGRRIVAKAVAAELRNRIGARKGAPGAVVSRAGSESSR